MYIWDSVYMYVTLCIYYLPTLVPNLHVYDEIPTQIPASRTRICVYLFGTIVQTNKYYQ